MRAHRPRVLALLGFGALALTASPASAQVYIGGGSAPRAGSVEFSGGVSWTAGFDLGTANADLTRNPTTGSGPVTLFTADTQLRPSPGLQGRLGVYLTRGVSIEGGVAYSRPVLETLLSGDAEGATAAAVSETLTRYVFDGALVAHLGSFASGRGVPFVTGGVGYIRELHEGNELAETGTSFHGGGGVKYWFNAIRPRLGLRVEAGVAFREGGFDFEDGRRTLPTVAASLIYLF
jgi:hypothetical protein